MELTEIDQKRIIIGGKKTFLDKNIFSWSIPNRCFAKNKFTYCLVSVLEHCKVRKYICPAQHVGCLKNVILPQRRLLFRENTEKKKIYDVCVPSHFIH